MKYVKVLMMVVMVTILAVGTINTVKAGIPYAERLVGDNLRRTISIDTADVDLDGNLEIIGASRIDNAISWWNNDGQYNFTEHLITTSFEGAFFVDAVDIDQDGITDVIGAARIGDRINWWKNDGAGNFSENEVSSYFNGASCVHGIDMDADGDIDVLGVAEEDDMIAWFENDGEENFTQHTITDAFLRVRFAIATDLDKDGDMDILACAYEGNQIAWWENNGEMYFTKRNIGHPFQGAICAMPIDVDNDGDWDVVGASDLKGLIKWWENDGNQNWTDHVIANGLNGPRYVYPEDVDLDGRQDVLAVCWWEDDVMLYHNTGNNFFNPDTIDSNFDGAHSVMGVDLDKDNDIDIIAGAYKYVGGDIQWYENRLVQIAADQNGNPKNQFAPTEHVYGKTRHLDLPDGQYDMYVIEHYEGWNSDENQMIPPRVDPLGTLHDPETTIDVSNGNIGNPDGTPEDVWIRPPGGKFFDIVVDINNDGDFDPSVDLIDSDLGADFGFALPVELSSFTAHIQDDHIQIQWITESETGNQGFKLYVKHEEANPYHLLASYVTNSALVGSGNSTSRTIYGYKHPLEEKKSFYFLLVQVDFSGEEHEFGPILFEQKNQSSIEKTPDNFVLFQNYPNPFNPSTTIRYQLPEQSYVTLVVYDLLGNKVKTLVNDIMTAGDHRVQLDATDMSTGVYFVKMLANKHGQKSAKRIIDIKKIIFMK